jgi:hypothetical protein
MDECVIVRGLGDLGFFVFLSVVVICITVYKLRRQ